MRARRIKAVTIKDNSALKLWHKKFPQNVVYAWFWTAKSGRVYKLGNYFLVYGEFQKARVYSSELSSTMYYICYPGTPRQVLKEAREYIKELESAKW